MSWRNDVMAGKGTFSLMFEFREDGGLRVYSDDLPGLILSGEDPRAVLADVGPALEVLLDAMAYLRTKPTTPPPAR